MCEFCEQSKNMVLDKSTGFIKIIKPEFSNHYILQCDNSNNEYANAYAHIDYCPKCGKKFFDWE